MRLLRSTFRFAGSFESTCEGPDWDWRLSLSNACVFEVCLSNGFGNRNRWGHPFNVGLCWVYMMNPLKVDIYKHGFWVFKWPRWSDWYAFLFSHSIWTLGAMLCKARSNTLITWLLHPPYRNVPARGTMSGVNRWSAETRTVALMMLGPGVVGWCRVRWGQIFVFGVLSVWQRLESKRLVKDPIIFSESLRIMLWCVFVAPKCYYWLLFSAGGLIFYP